MNISLSSILLASIAGSATVLCLLMILVCRHGCHRALRLGIFALMLLWAGGGLWMADSQPDELRQTLYIVMLSAVVLLLAAFFSIRYAFQAVDNNRQAAAEAVLKAGSEARQARQVIDAFPDAVLCVDRQGVVRDANPAAGQMFACSRVQLTGQPLEALLVTVQPSAEPEAAVLAWPFTNRQIWAVRRGRRSDGRVFPLSVSCRLPTVGPGEGADLQVLVIKDISDSWLEARFVELGQRLDEKIHAAVGREAFLAAVPSDLLSVFSFSLAMLWKVVPDEAELLCVGEAAGPARPGGERRYDQVTPALHQALRTGKALSTVAQSGQALLLSRDDPPGAHGHHAGLLTLLDSEAGWLALLPLQRRRGTPAVLVIAGRRELGGPSLYAGPVAATVATVWQQVIDQQWLRLQGTAMSAAANAIFITDRDGVVEWVNEAFSRLSGFRDSEILGRRPSVLSSGFQDPEAYQRLWETILDKQVWQGEVVERRKDGTLYTVNQTITPVLDEQGNIAHFVAVHEDVTERKKAEERIAYLSNYDTLTRLPNRVLFRDSLYQAVSKARHERMALAVMFIDLDRFSRVNDTLGHDVGDQLLMTIASRINATAAPWAETIARVGGDEFAIIQGHLPNADTAASLAHKVIEAVNTPVDLDGMEVRVGANVGIAIFPQDGDDPDHLIKNADMAMYRAIRSETESCFFFSNEMNAEARIRLSLEGDLRKALDHGDLSLYFQPQVNAKSRKVVGVEALLRWNHPDLGPVSPVRFIPVAEDSGLILPIGDWVLEEAMRQSRAWMDAGLPPVTMAINISAVQFRQQGLVQKVADCMSRSGLNPERVELELTESMLMQDAREAIQVLHELSGLGAQLAIDDFGTGYSSLSYLKKFPVDKLKLDQSFVRHMTTDNNDAVIARATINLGHSLGLSVIAEGVEMVEQFSYLLREGCDEMQGYLFGKPMTATDLAALLQAQEDAAEGTVFSSLVV